MSEQNAADQENGGGALARALDWIERAGNKLADPALLFFFLLIAVWLLSALMSQFSYDHVDPRSGEAIAVKNLLTGTALTSFFSEMVNTFVRFHPLGVVLLAMLGIGVADYTGFIKAGLRALLNVTSQKLLASKPRPGRGRLRASASCRSLGPAGATVDGHPLPVSLRAHRVALPRSNAGGSGARKARGSAATANGGHYPGRPRGAERRCGSGVEREHALARARGAGAPRRPAGT